MPLLIGVALSVLDLALQCLLRRPRGEFWGVLSCLTAIPVRTTCLAQYLSGCSAAEVTSVVPSSTFVVFKFKSVSSTSVLTAGSPTFDPTGVALVLHPILERVLGLVLGPSAGACRIWRLVLDSGLYGKFTRLPSDSCSCACSGVRGSLGVCRSCGEFAICSDVSRLGAITTGCRLAFVAYTKQVVRRCFHIRRNLHVGVEERMWRSGYQWQWRALTSS